MTLGRKFEKRNMIILFWKIAPLFPHWTISFHTLDNIGCLLYLQKFWLILFKKTCIHLYNLFFSCSYLDFKFQGLVTTQQIKIFIQTWFFVQFDPFCSGGECTKRGSAYFGVFFGQFGDGYWPTGKKAASLCNSTHFVEKQTRVS